MYLVIAEKPSVSRAIARVIRAENREEGFLSGKDCIVSWCLGHLAEYLPPDGYDKRYESWKYEDLPIIPDEWKLAVSQEEKRTVLYTETAAEQSGCRVCGKCL